MIRPATLFILNLLLLWGIKVNAQKITEFTLPATTGDSVTLSQLAEGKRGVVLIFTSNHCIYSKKYEARIIELVKKYEDQFGFAMINSNQSDLSEYDTFESMKRRAADQEFPCPYLKDFDLSVARMMGAVKNPSAFVLLPAAGENSYELIYHGTLDNNPLMAEAATRFYVAETLDQILSGETPEPSHQPETGCHIKGL